MKCKFKAPGSERLKLKHDNLHSMFVFEFNLRQYTMGPITAEDAAAARGVTKPSAVWPFRRCSPRHPTYEDPPIWGGYLLKGGIGV